MKGDLDDYSVKKMYFNWNIYIFMNSVYVMVKKDRNKVEFEL